MKSTFFLHALGSAFLLITIASGECKAQDPKPPVPAGIEKLHQQDVTATLSQSISQLAGLWDDEGVLIGQGEKALVGKALIQASLSENFAKIRR